MPARNPRRVLSYQWFRLTLAAGVVFSAALFAAHDAVSWRQEAPSEAALSASGGSGFPAAARDEVPESPYLRGETHGRFAPAAVSDARRIAFSNGIAFDTRAGDPVLDPALAIEAYPAGRDGYHLVQLEGPIQPVWRESLEAAGAGILSYVPNYSYLVRASAEAMGRVRGLSFVVWSGLYQPAYKISGRAELARRDGEQIVTILVFPGESMAVVEAAIAAGGGRVIEKTQGGPNQILRAGIARADAANLARLAEVGWIEPWVQPVAYNNQCQWVVQTMVSGNRKIWDQGIRGQGQILSSADTGVRTDHNMFRDAGIPITTWGDYPLHRKVVAYRNPGNSPDVAFGDVGGHGTHTGGTLVGNDDIFAASANDGMAKDARLFFCDIGTSSGSLAFALDYYSFFQVPFDGNAAGAPRICSNSWGAPVLGAYTVESMQVDQFMWDHEDFLLVFANGNDGGPGTVGSPATAKNCISAGGTLNGLSATSIYSSTSRGPTADFRRKPTVCAPASLVSSTSASSTSYSTFSGTSMATPAISGALALARQYLEDGWYPTGAAVAANGFTPSAALLKAMAVNGGQNDIPAGGMVPDNNIGWGRIHLDQVLYFPADTRRSIVVDNRDGLLTGEFIEYKFQVTDTAQPLRISLVWTDYWGSPQAATQLVNNLNLTATGGGSTYLGNVFSVGQSVTGGAADNVNVEECVWRTTPASGLWTVRVDAANVPFGAQGFALVVSGGISANAGFAQLDRGHYTAGDIMSIRVEDANAGATVTVQVSSDTESPAENVVLSPLAGGPDGVYEGPFPTTIEAEASGDGALSVSHGDDITVSYSDPSPVGVSTATATVGLNAPVITNVGPLDVGSTAAVLGWTTSAAANSRVYYGTTPSLGQASNLDATYGTSHSHLVSGLATATTYYYDVESADYYGNSTRDDNGGAHYKVTTADRGDVLLAVGDGTFPEIVKYRTALVRTGWLWDEWGQSQVDNPPVGNPAVGMRSYPVVWWQAGWEQYPPITDAARDSITKYDAGGGRLCVFSHDVAWAFGDGTSGFSTPARSAWLTSELHAIWQVDPTSWTANRGVVGDPISGAYQTNIPYSPFRSGGAGDQIDLSAGAGTAAYVWRKQAPLPSDDCAVRWTSAVNNGSPDSAVWGGTPTRVVSNFFEWSRLNSSTPDDTTRAGILDKTLEWLIGRNHPAVAVTAPNGGEVFVGSAVSISWTESTSGGTSVASRRLEYSEDGGESWALITASPGTSPYSWSIASVPNSSQLRVRMTVVDNGSPSLRGQDPSNADFTINRPGGDTRGPVVVAGSPATTPTPAVAPGNFVLAATFDDTRTGNSNIAAAEWNAGAAAVAPGSGTPMGGVFTSPVVTARDTVDALLMPDGAVPAWVRGRDAAGAWGAAESLTIYVNGGEGTSVAGEAGGVPAVFTLGGAVPNPFNPQTSIRFSVPRAGKAALVVYDVTGREVRRLVDGAIAAGAHEVRWDGRDARGRAVASGVYFYRLEAVGESATRKMVLMK